MSGCGCGNGQVGAVRKVIPLTLGPSSAAPDPNVVAAEEKAKAMYPAKAAEPSGPSTGLLVAGGVGAVAAIAGIAYLATR